MIPKARPPVTGATLLDNVVAFDPNRRRRTATAAQAEATKHSGQPDDDECQFFRLDQAMALLIHMQAEGVDTRLQARWRAAIQAALASNPFSPVVVSIPEIQAFESGMKHVTFNG